MGQVGRKNPNASLENLGIKNQGETFWNLTPSELVEHSIKLEFGILNDTGALCIETGEFTGRSPKDRFIVKDSVTEKTVDWGDVNIPFSTDKFNALYNKVANHLSKSNVYVQDAFACAHEDHRLNIRLAAEFPWSAQFASNMFRRLDADQIETFTPEWNILCAPSFMAEASVDGTRQHNFAIINFEQKKIIIGGTGYTGEIKKGIFSVLNYILPQDKGVLAMHCSANVGPAGDTAVFFGLSGTGKTTLSADPERSLIGDDEHGWGDDGVFNFEGGCYAKAIDLSAENEPDIYNAIKAGAILENINFFEGTRTVDFTNVEITQNTRVSYPLEHINNALHPSKGGIPQNIFFLTADAFGVLPPISKLTEGQAMYHFISGYTAKVAGTEAGVVEPQTTFSACFGAPFMPLHPTKYAEMLGQKMNDNNVNIWLVNTGWSGGEYGTGSRIKLKYTRAMITAALEGKLNDATYTKHEVFGLNMPNECPGVPSEILNPKQTWSDPTAYDNKAHQLAKFFVSNFKQFEDQASETIMSAAPNVPVS